MLSHFYGNKLYINSAHLVLFRSVLTRTEVKKNEYGRIAAMYVLTMVPDEEKEVPTAQNALNGAMDIIAENISDNAEIRKKLRGIRGAESRRHAACLNILMILV